MQKEGKQFYCCDIVIGYIAILSCQALQRFVRIIKTVMTSTDRLHGYGGNCLFKFRISEFKLSIRISKLDIVLFHFNSYNCGKLYIY